MTRQFFCILCFVFALASCRQGPDASHARIAGTIAESQADWIYLEELLIRDRVVLDSMRITKEGSFTFFIDLQSPGFFLLRTNSALPLTMILHPGEDIHIQTNANLDPAFTQVTGSDEIGLLMDYFCRNKRIEQKIDSLGIVFRDSSGTANFLETKHGLDETYRLLFSNHKQWVQERIMENDTSILSLFLLNQRIGRDLLFPEASHLSLYQHLDSSLGLRYPSNIHAEDHRARVVALKRREFDHQRAVEQLQIGKPAPGFTLLNIEGQDVTLHSQKGKPILLYFWAGECAPCRIENQHIQGVLESMARVQLIAVSMDVHRQVWEGAIKLDGLKGMHVSDLMGKNSPMQQIYLPGRSIPYYYLLDEGGVILAAGNNLSEIKSAWLKQ